MQRLNGNTFSQQMWEYGLVAEEIPTCFNSSQFAAHYEELKSLVGDSRSTSPAMLSIYKNETSRRNISVPNPYAFAHTVKYLSDNYSRFINLASSENSDSPITFIHCYGNREVEYINSGLIRTLVRAVSSFRANLRRRIALAMGHRYRLSIDIATFYDTIYTHSLSWAVCGKDRAKRIFVGAERKTPEYNFADRFDARIRNQKSKETNGILTGPFTSRIFSELLLAGIDRELRKRSYSFRRYVDDYKFYFRSKYEAQRAIIEIARVFSEFNLSVNQSKIEVAEYPFDIESSLQKLLEDAKDESGVYGALNEASRLYCNGEKGAYKYALKMLEDELVPEQDRECVLSILLNINLIDPKLASLILGYLKKHKDAIGEKRLSSIINNELELSLQEGLEQEVLNLLSFLRILHLHVRGELVLEALKLNNDFISIIALDFWVNERGLVDRTSHQAMLLNAEVRNMEKRLSGQSMNSDHWLLLYEAKMHSFFNTNIQNGSTAPFFAEMEKLGISFYSI